ncbi:MAG: PaaI family thioesterase [Polyangiaceae bacterium]
MSAALSVQERYAASSICFGCGPANVDGLRIKSFEEDGGELVCRFTPAPFHHAFPGMLNGGIIGTLLDCHSNWAATMFLMRAGGLTAPPCSVTADFHVKLKRPTPMGPVLIRARVSESEGKKAIVEATLTALDPTTGEPGKITATCTGTFVAVDEGHPAYHRW